MSGKVFVLAAVGACVLLAGFAALRQSQTTRRIRELWGADGASVIQNAEQVSWRPASVGSDGPPIDLSKAAGLVHLRATLIDDVYLMPESESDGLWTGESSTVHRITFGSAENSVLVELDVESGKVHCRETGQSATLIPASRDAVREYLETLANEYRLPAELQKESA